MPELMSQRAIQPIDYRGVPLRYHPSLVRDKGRVVGVRSKLSAVCRSIKDCEDLIYWYGDESFCPMLPILLLIPQYPTLLVGWGYATAAELKDDAVNLWGKYTQRIAQKGSIVDFDELREKARLPRREDVKQLTAEAFHERIKAHLASPITDPPRQPRYVRPNGKTVHTVAKIGESV